MATKKKIVVEESDEEEEEEVIPKSTVSDCFDFVACFVKCGIFETRKIRVSRLRNR